MIFYLHIPKTGGQTLGSRLSSAFPHQRSMAVFRDFAFPTDAPEMPSMAERYDFIEGHVSGPLFEEDYGYDFVCTVRNPIDAIISEYNHILREPRNIYYRPASQLSVQNFFDQFGDCFFNNQSHAIVGAFHALRGTDNIDESGTWLRRNLESSCDKIRWLVPTELIDDFTLIWQIETGKRMANNGINLNISAKSEQDIALRNIISQRIDLFSIDTELWLTAQKRYKIWREKVLWQREGTPVITQSRTVFSEGGCFVRLLEGWHDPERRTTGDYQYWAGPLRVSKIDYEKPAGPASLNMRAICFYGILPEDVHFFDSDGRQLKVSITEDALAWKYSIEMPEAANGTIAMRVPDVRSAGQISTASSDFIRRSIATENWLIAPGATLV